MVEELLVYGAVLCAVTYATWRLMPGALRMVLAERCATLLRRRGLDVPAARLDRVSAKASGACGGCTGCVRGVTPASVAIVMKHEGQIKHVHSN